MWTDLAAQLWPALPLFFFAGACFVIAGTIWRVAIWRHNRQLPPPPRHRVPMPAITPAANVADDELRRIADHLRREDADTHVVARIPGATPVEWEPEYSTAVPQPAEVAESALIARRIPPYLTQGWQHDTVTALRTVTGPTAEETERLAARLRAPLDIGPVCPTCGGPWGNCTCAIKTARAAECPLTTDEIRIPTTGDTPDFEAQRRGDTCELSAKLAKARDAA